MTELIEKEKNENTATATAKNNLQQALDYAKTHRVKVSDKNGKTWINFTVLVAAILTVIMPEIAALLAIVAIAKGGSIRVIDTKTSETDFSTR